ncbi:protein PRRC1-like isoform X2 [Colias croceus]|uniref:protein PRRC1-like isoform X2 n=1 Tax=Colias crocea TaxID=72248 RepID=UPI001E27C313|nr:protein PRRC1-like isoform X2 [Colias croceus]
MNHAEKRNKIPAAPTLAATGNLLSSVAPPSELPNFITTSVNPVAPVAPVVQNEAPVSQTNTKPAENPNAPVPMDMSPQTPEKFSPAIPPSKGEPTVSIRSPVESDSTLSPGSLPESGVGTDKIGDIMPGSGLITWMKGAMSSGGILQKVAEKAKNSVDSMITTLDPQMKEYLNNEGSGGDLYIVVASDKEVKVSPVREAFQTVFGKATIVGEPAQSDVTAAQPVGYAAAYAAAKQRIAHLRSVNSQLHNNVPIVAIESFVYEAMPDRWYDIALLVLSQPSLGIELQVQSQGTPIPSAAVLAAREATPTDYAHAQTGYNTTIGSIMSANLQVPHTQWQEASTSVSRRELLLLASRSLAGSYQRMLAVSAAET